MTYRVDLSVIFLIKGYNLISKINHFMRKYQALRNLMDTYLISGVWMRKIFLFFVFNRTKIHLHPF